MRPNFSLIAQVSERDRRGLSHRNISNFGGNPTNVTLMGQSAGAINVYALLTTPARRPQINQTWVGRSMGRAVWPVREPIAQHARAGWGGLRLLQSAGSV